MTSPSPSVLICSREEREFAPKQLPPASRGNRDSRAKLVSEHIGRDVRAIYGGHPFADVRRGLRIGRGVFPRLQQPVQVTPSNFCRSLTGWSFPLRFKPAKQPRGGFSKSFDPALSFGAAHGGKPITEGFLSDGNFGAQHAKSTARGGKYER